MPCPQPVSLTRTLSRTVQDETSDPGSSGDVRLGQAGLDASSVPPFGMASRAFRQAGSSPPAPASRRLLRATALAVPAWKVHVMSSPSRRSEHFEQMLQRGVELYLLRAQDLPSAELKQLIREAGCSLG